MSKVIFDIDLSYFRKKNLVIVLMHHWKSRLRIRNIKKVTTKTTTRAPQSVTTQRSCLT